LICSLSKEGRFSSSVPFLTAANILASGVVILRIGLG
jgi:hypothetical protein